MHVIILRKPSKKMLTKESVLGYICIAGNIRFTASQYKFISTLIGENRDGVTLPTYKNIRSSYTNLLYKYAFPNSIVTSFNRNSLRPQ